MQADFRQNLFGLQNRRQFRHSEDARSLYPSFRDAIRGYWYERNISFDASLMKQGRNVLKLTIPPGNPMNGIEYDYLRLELQ